MSDLISRQAAIDAAIEAADDWDGGCNIGRQKRIEEYIRRLPPAQPKRGKWIRDGHHIRCDQCGIYMCDTDREGDRIPTEFCPNRDKEHCTDSHNECPVVRFIEDVLQVKLLPYQKLLVTHVFETDECKGINLCSDCRTKMEKKMDDTVSRQSAIDAVRMVIGDNRSISVCEAIEQLPSAEPKTGKWILDRSGAYCCSECMEPCAGYVMMKPRDKFCKMCGSRNEVTT